MKELLLLHGALGSKEQFINLEIALSASFKIHAFNFSGHGSRPSQLHAFTIQNLAHEVLDWMNENYLQTIDIFGYSMGGYVALWLTRFYPDRVGKVFTLGTKLLWNEEVAEKEIQHLNPEVVLHKVPAFAQSLSQRHGEHEWKSLMLKTVLLMKDLAHTHLSEQDFLKIESRVLLARGENDDTVSAKEVEDVHHLLKNSMVKCYPDVSHPFEKIPMDLLWKEITDFFT